MSSRDGARFRRWAEAFIPPGQNKDKWGNRRNYIWWGLVETKSDLPGASPELSLYTNEHYYMEGGVRTRRYTLRLDGFVSVSTQAMTKYSVRRTAKGGPSSRSTRTLANWPSSTVNHTAESFGSSTFRHANKPA